MAKGKIEVDEQGGLVVNKKFVFGSARIIEDSLSAFGITTIVAEINMKPEQIEFCLELALGTSIDDIVRHHKDLGMALASISGDVEIEAPIPGRALIAIRLPIDKKWTVTVPKYMNPMDDALDKVSKTELSTKGSEPPSWRQMIATFFYLIGGSIGKLGNLIDDKK